jgi:hypothetical protein
MSTGWVAVGSRCWRVNGIVAGAVQRIFAAVYSLLGSRAKLDCWIKYHVILAGAACGNVELAPLTEELYLTLLRHPERRALETTENLWTTGFRTAFIQLEEDRPICIQWLITPAENQLLPKLGEWSGLYLPLSPGVGQTEGLFTFPIERKKGVATEFEFSLYDRARALGLTELVTHIEKSNAATHKWAKKTGWSPLGEIQRLQLDLPLLRRFFFCVHSCRDGDPEPDQAAPGKPASADSHDI